MSEIDIILYEKIKWHQCFSRYYSAQHCLLISLPFKRYGALKNLKIVLSNKFFGMTQCYLKRTIVVENIV